MDGPSPFPRPMSDPCDVLIVGGGLSGGALGLALARASLRVVLVEAQAGKPAADDRALTLAPSSRALFETLDLWSAIEAACHPVVVREIHVSDDRSRVGGTHIAAASLDVEALGYVVGHGDLASLVTRQLADTVEVIAPGRLLAYQRADAQWLEVQIETPTGQRTVRTRLLVGSDGTLSTVRRLSGIGAVQHDYLRDALVLRVSPQWSLEGVAYERFTTFGPLALLPRTDGATLVATVPRGDADPYQQHPETLCAWAMDRLRGRGGPLAAGGAVHRFPLRLLRAETLVSERVVLIGNAAHTVHPVAGQGLNLGLRDVAVLAELLGTERRDTGAPELLARYERLRRSDIGFTSSLTHTLMQWFSPEHATLGPLRGLALLALDVLPGAKQALARRTMGGFPVLTTAKARP